VSRSRSGALAFAIAFAALAVADLAAIATGHPEWRVVTKPPLMWLLAGGVIAAQPRLNRARRFLVAALLLSSVGDTILLGTSDAAFIGGTAAFALSHLAYIACFTLCAPGKGLVQQRPWLIVVYALAWGLTTAILWPHLGALAAVVVPYSLLLTTMAVFALNLVGRIELRSAIFVAAGAAIYMSSDTNIAFGRFDPSLAPPHVDFLIMLTYLIAQSLIVTPFVTLSGAQRA
jgi:uncharacterized membrane protein YhhN